MKNKKVLVTGGTGSLGYGMIRELLNRNVGKIKVYARNEAQMVKLIRNFDTPKLVPVIGDVRDRVALQKACQDCDVIFHLAALKHVPICEAMPVEAIKTNIIGTQNVIDCAIAAQAEKMIYISTDKAVDASGAYGCTKRLGEKLVLAADQQSRSTRFMAFRSGNLLGSAGSVLPLFQSQIANAGAVTLTDEHMTRFFITIEKATKLLCEIAERGTGGEIFLPVMQSLAIKDIAQYLLRRSGLDDHNVKVIGIRPGERLHEQMVADTELSDVFRMTNDLFFVGRKELRAADGGSLSQVRGYPYQSDKAVISYEQATAFLQAAGIMGGIQ